MPGWKGGPIEAERLASYLATCPFERAVLIPASDAAVRAIAGLPAGLAERFPSSIASLDAALQLTDKSRFAELLRRLGEPAPKTRRIDSVADIAAVPTRELEGAFLKPVDSASYMARFGVKGERICSRADALAKVDRALSHGFAIVLQDYIPSSVPSDVSGPAADHILIDGFVDADGRITAMFARRRLRMFPLDFGNTSCMISIPLCDVAAPARSMQRIADALGWRGIMSAEFKLDPRDGVYKLLEINSRVWWFVEYAGRCGVDLCTMSYRDALGERIEPVTDYAVGARFFHAYFDFHAVRAKRREGTLRFRNALLSWTGAQEPTFNWSDPLPALADIVGRVGNLQVRVPRSRISRKKPQEAKSALATRSTALWGRLRIATPELARVIVKRGRLR